jgi:folate-dependent tRNA-U54 methylase TrmFO/GidA
VFTEERAFNGVKVFSATMVTDREQLGEKITDWIQNHQNCEVRDAIVTQSSDEAFHCIAITLFYWEDNDKK